MFCDQTIKIHQIAPHFCEHFLRSASKECFLMRLKFDIVMISIWIWNKCVLYMVNIIGRLTCFKGTDLMKYNLLAFNFDHKFSIRR